MPQFDFAHVFWPQLAWLAVLFAVLYFGVIRATLPRLDRAMGAREDQIGGDLEAAKTARDSAEALENANQQAVNLAREAARGRIAEAKASATHESAARMAEALSTTEAQISDAEKRIALACLAADKSLREIATEGALAIVSRLTGSQADAASARKLVDDRIGG